MYSPNLLKAALSIQGKARPPLIDPASLIKSPSLSAYRLKNTLRIGRSRKNYFKKPGKNTQMKKSSLFVIKTVLLTSILLLFSTTVLADVRLPH